MKRNFFIVLALWLAFVVLCSACGKVSSESDSADTSSGSTTDSKNDSSSDSVAFYDTLGISQSEFDNEVKYPIKKSEYDYILYAEDYGVNGGDLCDDTVSLQNCIDWASKKGDDKSKLIILPEGNVFISEGFNPKTYEYGLVIEGIKNLTILGKDTNVYFNSTLNEFTGIFVSDCENVKFAYINIDWATLPFSMGRVIECDTKNRQITVKVDDNYPIDENFQVIEYLEYNANTGLPRTNGNFAYIHNTTKQISALEYLGEQTVKISFSVEITAAPVGTRTVLAHSMTMGETIFAHGCKNLYFEHVDLYASKGMAVRVHTSDNLYFNHFRAICKPGSDRLMTSTADILHLKNCAGEIVITNSQFENSHDDAINIAGHFCV